MRPYRYLRSVPVGSSALALVGTCVPGVRRLRRIFAMLPQGFVTGIVVLALSADAFVGTCAQCQCARFWSAHESCDQIRLDKLYNVYQFILFFFTIFLKFLQRLALVTTTCHS